MNQELQVTMNEAKIKGLRAQFTALQKVYETLSNDGSLELLQFELAGLVGQIQALADTITNANGPDDRFSFENWLDE